MLGPLLAIFTEYIGGDILDVTWAWAIYLFASGFFTILLGKYSDRVSKKKMMVAGYTLNAVFTFGYLLVDTPFKLFAIQAEIGVAGALATPTWYAPYSEYEDRKKRRVSVGACQW
jgi:MFS family permease